jgi:hypothetical protein
VICHGFDNDVHSSKHVRNSFAQKEEIDLKFVIGFALQFFQIALTIIEMPVTVAYNRKLAIVLGINSTSGSKEVICTTDDILVYNKRLD